MREEPAAPMPVRLWAPRTVSSSRSSVLMISAAETG
jgi:hypothetical protein